MSDKKKSALLLVKGDNETNSLIRRRMLSRALADKVMDNPSGTPDRWKAIFTIWFNTHPTAKEDHSDACEEAREARMTMIDKDFGKTKATLGIAYGEEANKNVNQRFVAVLPQELRTMLKRYDPALCVTNPKEQRKIWRQVYNTFPCYRTTNRLDTY